MPRWPQPGSATINSRSCARTASSPERRLVPVGGTRGAGPQLALEHLARRVEGEAFDDLDVAGHLEVGDVLAREVHDRFVREDVAVPGHDERGPDLAEALVGYADDGHLGDPGHAGQRPL